MRRSIPDINEYCREIVFDHLERPRNVGRLSSDCKVARRESHSCDDQITVYIRIDETGRLQKVVFEAKGCYFCKASASIMTESVMNLLVEEALNLARLFIDVALKRESAENLEDREEMAALTVVATSVKRGGCITLAWFALETALQGEASSD